jgi:hypothetical protein
LLLLQACKATPMSSKLTMLLQISAAGEAYLWSNQSRHQFLHYLYPPMLRCLLRPQASLITDSSSRHGLQQLLPHCCCWLQGSVEQGNVDAWELGVELHCCDALSSASNLQHKQNASTGKSLTAGSYGSCTHWQGRVQLAMG